MGLFKKMFGNDDKSGFYVDHETKGPSITFGPTGITESAVGTPTNSSHGDFYVYEWFIKDTGEVFYIGKGRGNRYKEFHKHAYEAERIKEQYDTDNRFVGENLSEDEALILESEEMWRVLNETNDRLTNRIIPFTAKKGNGFSKSPSAPPLSFEAALVLYACEIDEHWFGVEHRNFDEVTRESLSRVHFVDKVLDKDVEDVVYGGNYLDYYNEVCKMLSEHGYKTVKSKFAKSVTCWIYPGDDYVTNYEISEQKAEEKLGRHIPAFHLIDVWKWLKSNRTSSDIQNRTTIEVKPVYSRIPISEIKNRNNFDKGFDAGFPLYEKGEEARKAGDLALAISLYNQSRANGYLAPVLYRSYIMAFRKLKAYADVVAIAEEGVEVLSEDNINPSHITYLIEAKQKALKQLG